MKQFIGWTVVAVTALFVGLNLKQADVWFFGIQAQMPVAFVVIASALLGAAATYTFLTLKKSK